MPFTATVLALILPLGSSASAAIRSRVTPESRRTRTLRSWKERPLAGFPSYFFNPAEATTNTAPAPCGVIPSTAQAYSIKTTAVPHAGGAVDYISPWPAGLTQPFVATFTEEAAYRSGRGTAALSGSSRKEN